MPGCVLHKVSAVLSVSGIFAGQNGLKKPGMEKKEITYMFIMSAWHQCASTLHVCITLGIKC